MHGLGEYTGRWERVAQYFTMHEFKVHCVDFPGHGRTSGHPKGHVGDEEVVKRVIEILLSFDEDSTFPKFMVPLCVTNVL